jgi:hypothetical protein
MINTTPRRGITNSTKKRNTPLSCLPLFPSLSYFLAPSPPPKEPHTSSLPPLLPLDKVSLCAWYVCDGFSFIVVISIRFAVCVIGYFVDIALWYTHNFRKILRVFFWASVKKQFLICLLLFS